MAGNGFMPDLAPPGTAPIAPGKPLSTGVSQPSTPAPTSAPPVTAGRSPSRNVARGGTGGKGKALKGAPSKGRRVRGGRR